MDMLICLWWMSYILTISENIHFWRSSILHRLFCLACNLLLLHALFQHLTTLKEPTEHQPAMARTAAQGQSEHHKHGPPLDLHMEETISQQAHHRMQSSLSFVQLMDITQPNCSNSILQQGKIILICGLNFW